MISNTVPPSVPRTALVTGAGRRLGRAMALTLADAGYDVALHCHRSLADTEELAAEIIARGRAAIVLQADLTDERATTNLLPHAQDALGPIGVLVNNASTFARDSWESVTRDTWDFHLETNLRAPFVLAQAFARQRPPGGLGVIVNMLDQRVWAPTPHFVSYTVSKAGLWALTQSLALALAPHIRVCAIGPGPVLPSLGETDEAFAQRVAKNPLGQGGSPDDVGRALLAILELRSMTGQMIALDGGQHLNWSPASIG